MYSRKIDKSALERSRLLLLVDITKLCIRKESNSLCEFPEILEGFQNTCRGSIASGLHKLHKGAWEESQTAFFAFGQE